MDDSRRWLVAGIWVAVAIVITVVAVLAFAVSGVDPTYCTTC